jgi:hypothetical protein
MKRVLFAGLASVALLAGAAQARVAIMIAPAPMPQRVATADVIVFGKVTGFADKTVSAKPSAGATDKVEYQIAIVEIKDGVQGAKDMKEIKVGFLPPGAGPGGPIRPGRRGPQFSLAVDQEVCLFLAKHPDADFYVPTGNAMDVINKKDNTNFDKDMDEVKRLAKLAADPMTALKGKNADDRTTAALMLTARYRTPRPMSAGDKFADVDAEESKQVLLALADADWTVKPAGPGPRIGFQMSPLNSFFQLGLTEKDGWRPPQDGKELEAAAKKWLKDNADKYRIQKFADDKKEDKKDK